MLVVAAVLGGILLALVGLAFTSPVQTWVARRVLASHPEWGISVGRVEAGWNHVRLSGCVVHYAGAVLTLPALEASLPLGEAALHHRVAVSQLVARGWTLDLAKYHGPEMPVRSATAIAAPASFSLITTAHAAEPTPPVHTVFQGIFRQLQVPFDLTLDGMSLEGGILLPATATEPAVRIRAELVGGGVGPGREGTFNLASRFDISGAGTLVRAMEVRGVVKAVMDTPHSFSKLSAQLDSQARGPAFPQGVQLTADLSAARVPGGESYALTVQSVGKRLLDVQASYPEDSSRLGGVWRMDMRDTDVAPFTLGLRLPTFEAVGSGMFEADTGFEAIHTAGRIKSSASHLEILRPELADVGPLTVFSEFDLTQSKGTTRLDRLSLTINGAQPVMKVDALQSFEFNLGTGELKVADPQADLLAIDLQGVPVAWSRPFLPDWELQGGSLTGRLTASARDGGLVLRSTEPLKLGQTVLTHQGRTCTTPLVGSLQVAADYTPLGWQINVPELALGSAARTWLHLAVKAGQLARSGQPMKATGQLSLNLPDLLHQPGLDVAAPLQAGKLQLDFSANLGEQKEFQADLKVTGSRGPEAVTLPDIACNARATLHPSGRLEFSLPLAFSRSAPPRASDVTLSGSLEPVVTGYRLKGQLAGKDVYLEDLQLLAGLAGARGDGTETISTPTAAGRDEQPFWQGIAGTLAIAFRQLHYGDEFTVHDAAGSIQIDGGTMKIDQIKAGVGEKGSLKADADVSFRASDQRPYALKADVAVADFDPGPLFKAVDPTTLPQVEGKFDIQTQLSADGRNVDDLMSRARGDLHLTSNGGVFRLLSTHVSTKVEAVGKVAAIGAFLGNMASALRPGKKASEFANNAQAVAELTDTLSAIQYDQLNVDLVRDDALNTDLKNFALTAPEIRLVGGGKLTATPGVSLLRQPLAMEFTMKARGRTGEVLRYLRVLGDQTDALGYNDCTLPLKIGGTLADPDKSEIETALAQLAVERSGAGDLFNKLLGK